MFEVLESLQMRLQSLNPDFAWSSLNDSQFLLLYSFSSYILSFARVNTVDLVTSELHTFNIWFQVLGEHTFSTEYCDTQYLLKSSRISLNSDQSYQEMKRIIGAADLHASPENRFAGGFYNKPLLYYIDGYHLYEYHEFYAGLGLLTTLSVGLSLSCLYILQNI